MKKLSTADHTDYDILLNKKVILTQRNAPCFSRFLRESRRYNIIKIYNLSCEQTIDYKEFYLKYITDCFKIESNYDEELDCFTFKSTGVKYKDLIIMTLIRFLWEYICGNRRIDNSEMFFEKLKSGKSKYRNKLKRFCDFYSKIDVKENYISDGHAPNFKLCVIKSTQDFIKKKKLTGVNVFFYK